MGRFPLLACDLIGRLLTVVDWPQASMISSDSGFKTLWLATVWAGQGRGGWGLKGWKLVGVNAMVFWQVKTKEGKQFLRAILAHITDPSSPPFPSLFLALCGLFRENPWTSTWIALVQWQNMRYNCTIKINPIQSKNFSYSIILSARHLIFI